MEISGKLCKMSKNRKRFFGRTVNEILSLIWYNKGRTAIRKEGAAMKIRNIRDVDQFLKVVESCKGSVELVTGEGDRLNLKSKLCQYISLATIFSNSEKIPNLEIIASETEDRDKLLHFMENG